LFVIDWLALLLDDDGRFIDRLASTRSRSSLKQTTLLLGVAQPKDVTAVSLFIYFCNH